MLHANGSTRDVLVDAGIAGGSAFFGAIAGVAIVQLRADPLTYLIAGGIAAGVSFFGSLMASRRRTPP